jgi:hypothetical protein
MKLGEIISTSRATNPFENSNQFDRELSEQNNNNVITNLEEFLSFIKQKKK